MIKRVEAYSMVGPGWRMLLDKAFDIVESKGINVLRVKEKFGALQVYTDKYHPEIGSLSDKSLTICEMCGARGSAHQVRGWVKTLCNFHARVREDQVR